MTTLPILIELAKRGDATAIATLINAALTTEKIRAKVLVDQDYLLVLLRSLRPLNQHATIAFLRRGLFCLQPASIQRVRVYAWHLGQEFPTWIAEVPIVPAIPQISALEITAETPISATTETLPEIAIVPAASVSEQPKPNPPTQSTLQRFRFGFLFMLAVVAYLMGAIA